jgi:serine/threonine protein kinase, bacterial
LIRKLNLVSGPLGVLSTIAGNGIHGDEGDETPALSASFCNVVSMSYGGRGELYLSDSSCHRVRRIDPDGIVTSMLGKGIFGLPSADVPASETNIGHPGQLAVSPVEDALFVTDSSADRVYKLSP